MEIILLYLQLLEMAVDLEQIILREEMEDAAAALMDLLEVLVLKDLVAQQYLLVAEQELAEEWAEREQLQTAQLAEQEA